MASSAPQKSLDELSIQEKFKAYHEAFSQHIHAYRTRRNLSHDELADFLGVSSRTLIRYEREAPGSQGISFDLLLRLAESEEKTLGEYLEGLELASNSIKPRKAGKKSRTPQAILTQELEAVPIPQIENLVESSRSFSSTHFVPNGIAWILDLGAKLLRLSEVDMLEVELNINDRYTKNKNIPSSLREEIRERTKFILKRIYNF